MFNSQPDIVRQVFTPETLARRWACSARHVRNLISDGQLKAFRLGGKLLRIHARDVEEFETCSGGLENTGDNGQRSPELEPAENVMRLARIERAQKGLSIA